MDTFSLVCFTAEESGLDQDVWLVSRNADQMKRGRPYFQIRRRIGWKKIWFSQEEHVPERMRIWMCENKAILIAHWEGDMTDM